MDSRKLLKIGSGSLGVVLPPSLLREFGWVIGDRVGVFAHGRDIVIRNDSERAARFVRRPPGQRDGRNDGDAR